MRSFGYRQRTTGIHSFVSTLSRYSNYKSTREVNNDFDVSNIFLTWWKFDLNKFRLSGEYMPLKIRSDQIIQTEMHVLPTIIDKNYSSSLWVHRRKALHLVSLQQNYTWYQSLFNWITYWQASICQCVTRSTQTSNSHFRTGICLQTLMPKEKEVQTNTDISTNTLKSKKYIFGLRGKDKDVQVIDCAFNKWWV